MAFIRRLHNQNWSLPPNILDLIDEDPVCRLVDEMGGDIYGNVNPDTLPKNFKC